MCRLMQQHVLLGLTVMLLNAGGSDGDSPGNHSCEFSFGLNDTKNGWILTIPNVYAVIGLIVLGFLIVLSLACHYITCIVIMTRNRKDGHFYHSQGFSAERRGPVPHSEDKEQTRAAGEDELWYTTVNFTQEANDSDHVTKFDPKSEYATVVINTPALSTTQLDCVGNNAEETQILCLEG